MATSAFGTRPGPAPTRCLMLLFLAAQRVALPAVADAACASGASGAAPAAAGYTVGAGTAECTLGAKSEALGVTSFLQGRLNVKRRKDVKRMKDWVPLGPVDADLQNFTRNLLALCAKRRRLSDQELEEVSSALGKGHTHVDKMYALLGHTLLWHTPAEGMHLEFGVANGRSANISGLILDAHARGGNSSPPVVDGFDTFEGLPLDWDNHLKKGSFAQLDGKPPPVAGNVRLHKGLFNDTLPGFLAERPEAPLAFANIDGDLYMSAIDVLRLLKDRLRVGSVLHFHELIDKIDDLNPMEELRALHDFLVEQQEGGAPLRLELLGVVSDAAQPVVLRVAATSR